VNGPARYHFGVRTTDPAEALDSRLAEIDERLDQAIHLLRVIGEIVDSLRAELRND
jgi:hypothetical protein